MVSLTYTHPLQGLILSMFVISGCGYFSGHPFKGLQPRVGGILGWPDYYYFFVCSHIRHITELTMLNMNIDKC